MKAKKIVLLIALGVLLAGFLLCAANICLSFTLRKYLYSISLTGEVTSSSSCQFPSPYCCGQWGLRWAPKHSICRMGN